VGAEPEKDLAVLKVEAPRDELSPIAVGNSSDLLVGQVGRWLRRRLQRHRTAC
jgi:S1-C subfamily serine protease